MAAFKVVLAGSRLKKWVSLIRGEWIDHVPELFRW